MIYAKMQIARVKSWAYTTSLRGLDGLTTEGSYFQRGEYKLYIK